MAFLGIGLLVAAFSWFQIASRNRTLERLEPIDRSAPAADLFDTGDAEIFRPTRLPAVRAVRRAGVRSGALPLQAGGAVGLGLAPALPTLPSP
jgi:hypothetical protein